MSPTSGREPYFALCTSLLKPAAVAAASRRVSNTLFSSTAAGSSSSRRRSTGDSGGNKKQQQQQRNTASSNKAASVGVSGGGSVAALVAELERGSFPIGYRLAFSTPWVTQYRNVHNYLADFDAEVRRGKEAVLPRPLSREN